VKIMGGRSARGTRTYGGCGTSHSTTSAFGTSKKHLHLKFFPMDGKFTSEREVDEYLSGDTIQCLECGLEKKVLGKHLARHGINTDSYKIKYGIPLGRPLAIASYRLERAAIAQKVNASLTPKEMAERMRHMRNHPKRHYDFNSAPDFIKEKKSAIGKNNTGRRRILERVSTACPECGAECETAVNTAKRGNFLCAGCREIHYYNSQDKYFSENKSRIRENQRKNFARRMFNGDEDAAATYILNQVLKREITNVK